MRRILLTTLTLCMALAGMGGTAYADHLGPIVLGIPRTEEVLLCLKNDSLDKIIDLEEKSIAEKSDLADYATAAIPLLQQNRCRQEEVDYTPQKILREWNGRKYKNKEIVIAPLMLLEATVMQVTDGQIGTVTIYILLAKPQ
jgi:hypothetical protein